MQELTKLATEQSSYPITVYLKDDDGTPITPNNDVQWSLCNKAGDIINSRENVAYGASGSTLTINLTGNDLLKESRVEKELRYLIITCTYDSDLGADIPFTAKQAFWVQRIPVGITSLSEDAPIPYRSIYNIRNYGALVDGTTDDTAAIQLAFSAAEGTGGAVIFPGGITRGRPDVLDIGAGGFTIYGEPGAVFKVVDNPGDYRYLFSNSVTLSDFTITGLTIDQNPSTNISCNIEAVLSKMQFAFEINDGTNILFDNVYFNPCCGVNIIALQCDDVIIRDCYFRFVMGTNIAGDYDHSAVYIEGDGQQVINNRFVSTIADNARGAIELHGSNATSQGNISHGYRCITRAVTYSDSNPDPDENNILIKGNIAYEANDGINLWAITGHSLRGVVVTDNIINIANTQHAQVNHKGISFTYSVAGDLDGTITDVIIANNIITAEPETGRTYAGYDCAGILLDTTAPMSNILVHHNIIRHFPTQGIRFFARGATSGVDIDDNQIIDCGNDSAQSVRMSIYANGTPLKSHIRRNHLIDTVAPSLYTLRGIYSAVLVDSDLIIQDNIVPSNMTNTFGGYEAGIRWASMSMANGASLTVSAGAYEEYELLVAVTSTAFTITNAVNQITGQRLRFWIANTSAGSIGTITWGSDYNLAGAWVQPATGKRRLIEFEYLNSKWFEVYRSAADISN